MKKRAPARITPITPIARANEALGAGLHGATIELRAGDRLRVRTLSGESCDAVLADDVSSALADECLRTGRMVLIAATQRGPTILGALQTAPSPVQDQSGTLTLDATHVRIRGNRSLVLEAGPVSLRFDDAGGARFQGERLVVDMSSLVRFASMRVDLP